MQKNKRVCAYVRAAASKGAAAELQKQIDAINKYCNDNNLTLAHVYAEIASGRTPIVKRHIGAQMERDVMAGWYDAVIISSFDRLGRVVYDVEKFVKTLNIAGIAVVPADGNNSFEGIEKVRSIIMEVTCNAERNKCTK